MTFIRRALLLLLVICLGCVAQSAPPELVHKIEHQVRAFYTIPPDVKITVGNILPTSDVPGYDTVPVNIDAGNGKAKEYKFLISKDRNTLLRVTKFDLTKDAYADVMAKIDVTGRPSRGAKSAKVVVVNYDDFECPFCSRMHETLFPEILKEYGDRVEFVYKDYPLAEIHPWAIHAAVDANCLAAQNYDAYWDFADFIHANKGLVDNEKTPDARFDALDKMTIQQGQKHNLDATKLQACVKAQNEDSIRASMKAADELGVNATPTLFINGQRIDGVVPISEIRGALDAALKDAGQPVPEHTSSAAPVPAQVPASASK
ncbi:MAG TPA: thioredoxin domain-containing protein [Candidatus Sulfotelmatobacter sp.]|nr:thioredoxin domain-containing protein [Candidatus Sulfotelmatobacter sp.]